MSLFTPVRPVFTILALVSFLRGVTSQSCTQVGNDPSCTLGMDPFCSGFDCLYESCSAGTYAQIAFSAGELYEDSPVYFYCNACPGADQITDDQLGVSAGIGECYVPCGPVKCYVPSVGGTAVGAFQVGTGVCVNVNKGICLETCDVELQIPIPDAYSLNNTCISIEPAVFKRAPVPSARALARAPVPSARKRDEVVDVSKPLGPYADVDVDSYLPRGPHAEVDVKQRSPVPSARVIKRDIEVDPLLSVDASADIDADSYLSRGPYANIDVKKRSPVPSARAVKRDIGIDAAISVESFVEVGGSPTLPRKVDARVPPKPRYPYSRYGIRPPGY